MECVGVALARYAESLASGGAFKWQDPKWIYRPLNFVTFQIPQRRPIIVLTFSGHRAMFKGKAESAGLTAEWLKLSDMREYSVYKIEAPGQLLAATQFIRWGLEYKQRRKKPSTTL